MHAPSMALTIRAGGEMEGLSDEPRVIISPPLTRAYKAGPLGTWVISGCAGPSRSRDRVTLSLIHTLTLTLKLLPTLMISSLLTAYLHC